MTGQIKVQVIVDRDGRVVGARFRDERDKPQDNAPTARLEPTEGQRALEIDLPAEVVGLPGPDLHRFFSDLRVSWPAEVALPEIKIDRDRARPQDPDA
ncbi:hypothetical protein [Antarctobacter heliothermus]|uniref:Uncharacterized protein n=1 Tax=Antarctobacter heliothermus TaxID=74033 RepID=A0A239DXJ8_9RHOB|nr:hypothetical protein [Antarctobacter heliothermus]SNS37245.1 hypothetical protein SAMN04488078_101285 [Antarctobacter heliothermus]